MKYEANLTEEYYYTDIELSPDTISFSLPPVLPKHPSTNIISSKGEPQRSNEPELYNYAECELERPDSMTASELPAENISHATGQLGTDVLHRNTLYVRE